MLIETEEPSAVAAPIEIVQADLGDPSHTRAILDLLEEFALEPVSGGSALHASVRENLIPGLRKHPTTLILLAREGHAYIGMAICFIGFSTFYARPLINIHDLTVLPEHRGKAVGKRLIRAVEAEALIMDCCKVTLEVREDNEGARRLYNSEGFRGESAADGTNYFYMQKTLV